MLEPEAAAKGLGKNSAWARLIRKVYEVDRLECPECGARMKMISFITDPLVVRKILEHLGLWLAACRSRGSPATRSTVSMVRSTTRLTV